MAQSDAAAVMDWLALETYKALRATRQALQRESEVTGNSSDD